MSNVPSLYAAPIFPITLAGDVGSVVTTESCTSTTYVDLATVGPSVTLTTGSRVLVIMSAAYAKTVNGGIGVVMGVVVSGATTVAVPAGGYEASSDYSNSGFLYGLSRIFVLTGLTQGSNIFKLQYHITLGGTFTFRRRKLAVFVL